ncbi:MAG: hypothetical protein JKP98_18715 [Rhodobacteraceae bacterium]|nr:hypothetical protein [Paracoccaceae bacterium]
MRHHLYAVVKRRYHDWVESKFCVVAAITTPPRLIVKKFVQLSHQEIGSSII